MEKLNLFFTKFKELSFWNRVFMWGKIQSLSFEAYTEFKEFEKIFRSEKEKSDNFHNQIDVLNSQINGLTSRIQDFEKENIDKTYRIQSLENKIMDLGNDIAQKRDVISRFEANKEEMEKNYQKNLAQLIQIKNSFEKERERLNDERVREKEAEFAMMKKTWINHETDIENHLKSICRANGIDYIEKVPFSGKPDNTIKICDEFIIFDAKSPANDDLKNFPSYINEQAKNVKKYANQINVRKDIFLVIPSNTVISLPKFSYNMSDYMVYVVTKDSLEPLLLTLKRIEEYEFAEQLSPEDRDNICRVIGKFTHSTKRRIQIDQFFIEYNLEVLKKCRTGIPIDMLKEVSEIENAEIINPPSDKRGKQLLIRELEDKQDILDAEINGKNIGLLDK